MKALFPTIRSKLFLYLSLLMLTLQSINYFQNLSSIKEQTYSTFSQTNQTIHDFLSATIREHIYNDDIVRAEVMMKSIHNQNIQNIYLLNSDNEMLTSQKRVLPYDLEIINSTLKKHKDGLVNTADSSFYITTFYLLDIPMAYLVISNDLETLQTTIQEKRDSMMIQSSLLLLFSVIVSYFVSLLFTRPIEKIVKTLKNIKHHETLDLRLERSDEFGFLSKNIERSHNQLNRLNTHLEKEVNKKTKELQVLNEGLEERVKEEIDKNREQEKHMLYQSRLAQMGEMLSMIAHQWRQPLSAISATTNHLLIKTTLDRYDQELYQKKLQNISEYTQHLSNTIDDFKNFFKANKEMNTIDIESLIEGVLTITESSLKDNNIELSTDFQYCGTIHTFSNEVRQVLLNLIKNAEDIFKENQTDDSKIKIIAHRPIADSILISVQDNGGGIDEKIINRVFEPYFTTKEKREGTGLGLYMSKTIIEEHCQGKLTVENYEDGALFKVLLPISS